jgi:hypothetical protein
MTNTMLTVGDLDRDGAPAASAERAGVTRGCATPCCLGGGALLGGSA